MNEQIKLIWTEVCREEMPDLDESCMTLQRQKKFAELIVKECTRITEEAIAYELENSADLNPFFITREINNYFGIEE